MFDTWFRGEKKKEKQQSLFHAAVQVCLCVMDGDRLLPTPPSPPLTSAPKERLERIRYIIPRLGLAFRKA